jgi:hypothetical protein
MVKIKQNYKVDFFLNGNQKIKILKVNFILKGYPKDIKKYGLKVFM